MGCCARVGVLIREVNACRTADRHRGLPDPPRRSACSALPGALHPAASAHHGLPEGRTPGRSELQRGCSSCVDACVFSRATCGACGPSLSTPSPAALAFWRYDAPRDKRTSVGRTVDPLPFRRGKERGRAHSEAVSSSLAHAFPPVKTLQKDSGVWITRPQHTSSLGSAHLHFLFIIPHPVCAVFAPPPLLLPSPFFPFATLPLLSSFPLLPSGLSSLCFPSFLCVILLSASDELGGPGLPPPLWTWGCETRLWFIYIFLASSWSL